MNENPLTSRTTIQVPRPREPDETRRRLIDAGLRLFGAAGLDGVSTRALADAAQTNLAAIPYHFGGKEAVYLAVARHIVETTGTEMRAAAQAAIDDVDRLSPGEAARSAGDLLGSVVRVVLHVPDAQARGGFILREQLQPTAAFDVLYDGFVEPLHVALSALVARATGQAVDAPETITFAHGLLGQALVFGMARQTLMRRLGRPSLGRADLDIILRAVAGLASAALANLPQGDQR